MTQILDPWGTGENPEFPRPENGPVKKNLVPQGFPIKMLTFHTWGSEENPECPRSEEKLNLLVGERC